ncbi:DUF7473 family protein [Halobaculum sp. D14]|uniref:DUF7473 family protein n=1 Tax=unclassified Halobaculum TaxID=2640896 RepID=UPI003EBF9654
MAPLQAALAPLVGGFLLIALLSTLLANAAAYFVMGDRASLRLAVAPGVTMALVSLTAAVLPVYAVIAFALVADFAVIYAVYDLPARSTAIVTAMHYALTVILAYSVNSLLAIYQTAPG